MKRLWLSLILLTACQSPTPVPNPTPSPGLTPSPTVTASATVSPNPSARTTAALAGCWQDSGNAGRQQHYTATGAETLDLKLVVNGSERLSKVRLKSDGFLEILNEPSLGETLQWVGDQLIFRINGSQVATFVRCG